MMIRGSMTVRPHEATLDWPLTALVRAQLAIAAVWGPYLLGLLVLLPIAALTMFAGTDAGQIVDGRLALAAVVVVGALATVRVMPRVWPAANRVPPARLLWACILGPAVAQLLAVAARLLGHIPAKGSMDLVEMLAILACSLGGACVSWVLLHPPAEE